MGWQWRALPDPLDQLADLAAEVGAVEDAGAAAVGVADDAVEVAAAVDPAAAR